VLGAVLAATIVFASSAPDPVVDPHSVVEDTVKEFSLPGVHVRVRYHDCGFINAAYIDSPGFIPWGDGIYVEEHDVLICNEILKESPGFLRVIVAHEMSHAITEQYRIPTTGSVEAAADELASVILLADGYRKDLEEAADWFKVHDDGDPNTTDEHPSNARRAFILKCYADGSVDSGAPHCRYLLTRAAINWARLIALSGGR